MWKLFRIRNHLSLDPIDKPIVAAINGTCMAAGFEMLLGTDIRIAADHAQFALPEVQRALVPFAGSMARLPRQVPYAVAMRLLLTGEPFDAAEAWRIGLVNDVVAREEVMPRALAIARRIERNGPLALQAVKRTAVASSGLPLSDAYDLEDAAKREVLATADAREGPRAFIDKREARYEGR